MEMICVHSRIAIYRQQGRAVGATTIGDSARAGLGCEVPPGGLVCDDVVGICQTAGSQAWVPLIVSLCDVVVGLHKRRLWVRSADGAICADRAH